MGVLFQQAPLCPPALGVRVTADPAMVALPTAIQLGQAVWASASKVVLQKTRVQLKKNRKEKVIRGILI